MLDYKLIKELKCLFNVSWRLFIYSATTSTGYLCRCAPTAIAHCSVVVFVTIYFIVICYFALNCCGISLVVVVSPSPLFSRSSLSLPCHVHQLIIL